MTEPKGNVSAKLYFFGAWAKMAFSAKTLNVVERTA